MMISDDKSQWKSTIIFKEIIKKDYRQGDKLNGPATVLCVQVIQFTKYLARSYSKKFLSFRRRRKSYLAKIKVEGDHHEGRMKKRGLQIYNKIPNHKSFDVQYRDEFLVFQYRMGWSLIV